MAKLSITANQKTVIDAVDSQLDTAFAEGVEIPGPTAVLPPLDRYSDMPTNEKPLVRNVFRSVLAGIMKALNIPRALPNTLSTTVTLAKLTPGGTNGSLTFTDGMLTSKTDPT